MQDRYARQSDTAIDRVVDREPRAERHQRGRNRPDVDPPGDIDVRLSMRRKNIDVRASSTGRGAAIQGDFESDRLDREREVIGVGQAKAHGNIGLRLSDAQDAHRFQRDLRRLNSRAD